MNAAARSGTLSSRERAFGTDRTTMAAPAIAWANCCLSRSSNDRARLSKRPGGLSNLRPRHRPAVRHCPPRLPEHRPRASWESPIKNQRGLSRPARSPVTPRQVRPPPERAQRAIWGRWARVSATGGGTQQWRRSGGGFAAGGVAVSRTARRFEGRCARGPRGRAGFCTSRRNSEGGSRKATPAISRAARSRDCVGAGAGDQRRDPATDLGRDACALQIVGAGCQSRRLPRILHSDNRPTA